MCSLQLLCEGKDTSLYDNQWLCESTQLISSRQFKNLPV